METNAHFLANSVYPQRPHDVRSPCLARNTPGPHFGQFARSRVIRSPSILWNFRLRPAAPFSFFASAITSPLSSCLQASSPPSSLPSFPLSSRRASFLPWRRVSFRLWARPFPALPRASPLPWVSPLSALVRRGFSLFSPSERGRGFSASGRAPSPLPPARSNFFGRGCAFPPPPRPPLS